MGKINRVEFQADFSPLIDSMGYFDAMAESVKNPGYTHELMHVAHGVAQKEFNVMAAAAGATGSIAHMYEWGTQGINKGRSNMRPNPMDPRARLWTEVFNPSGLGGTLTYTFRQSLAIVPKPTVAQTGMTPFVISQMSDHVFKWKALVMEMGETVHIVPKEAANLMVPQYKNKSDAPEDLTGHYDEKVKRGYIMTKGPITATPGRRVAGNFTSFWTNFWESRGQQMMEESLESQILEDFEAGIEAQGRGQLRPPVLSVKAAVKAKSKKVQTEAKAKAKARRLAGERNNAK